MPNSYSKNELARASGVGPSAIRHYVRLGLMPVAERYGSTNRYDDRHLHRLMAIRRLRATGVRGDALVARMQRVSNEEILQLAGVQVVEPARAAQRSAASLREAVDSLVCTVAEALDISPRGLRPALALLFERMQSANVTAEQAASVVRGASSESRSA